MYDPDKEFSYNSTMTLTLGLVICFDGSAQTIPSITFFGVVWDRLSREERENMIRKRDLRRMDGLITKEFPLIGALQKANVTYFFSYC